MWIEKLDIKGFGRLTNRSFKLIKGFNIIYGSNESGKSTLEHFIKGMLFGLKGGRTLKDGSLPPLKKFKPWSGDDYSGFMEYKLDSGDTYRIGRNFSTNAVRVFDSLFNDITGSFDTARDKSVQFAELHLGMNEACFEKTAFIRQMDTRVDDDSSKELLGRLTNIFQTGYEDVSFNNACKALNELMKNRIGTDKTSTKPIDKITARLYELSLEKEKILQKREVLFNLEKQANELALEKNSLEEKLAILDRACSMLDSMRSIELNRKARKELNETYDNILRLEDELQVVLQKLAQFTAEKNSLEKFGAFTDDDLDAINSYYYRFLSLNEENEKLKGEINEKLGQIGEIQAVLQPLSALDDITIQSRVAGLNEEIAKLKLEQGKNNAELLNEKIKRVRFKDRLLKSTAVILSAAAAVSFVKLFSGSAGYLPVSAVTAAGAILMAVLAFKSSKELSGLTLEKRLSFISINRIGVEIIGKQELLDSLLAPVGAKNAEDFVRIKAAYDGGMQQVEAIRAEINHLEQKRSANMEKASSLDAILHQKLNSAGIEAPASVEITDEHIKDFKFGLSRYKSLAPSMKFVEQRAQDIRSNLEEVYKKASIICQCECSTPDAVLKQINGLSSKEASLKSNIDSAAAILEKADGKNLDCLPEGFDIALCKSDPNTAASFACALSDKRESVLTEIRKLDIKAAETRALMASLSNDDDDLQAVEEESEALRSRKLQLEELANSIKTALDVLTEASAEIQKSFAPVLSEKMGIIINKITNGKYTDLRADSSLYLKAVSPETGDIVPAPLLSSGTVDQIYLAMRLSAAYTITATSESVPFILDEIFSQYDDSRMEKALEYLAEAASGNQIILFTCKQRELETARKVCGNSLNVIELVESCRKNPVQ